MPAVDLTNFSDLAARKGTDYTQPPYRVPSKILDENFKKVAPASTEGETRPYSITQTEDGWLLNPEVLFDVCENGQLRRFKFVCQRAT